MVHNYAAQGKNARQKGAAWENAVARMLNEGGIPTERRTQYRGAKRDGPDLNVNAVLRAGLLNPALTDLSGKSEILGIECKFRKRFAAQSIAECVGSGEWMAVKIDHKKPFMAIPMDDALELLRLRYGL